MAYTIPVVALIIDPQAAAAALNLPQDFFVGRQVDDDHWQSMEEAVYQLEKLTGASISVFTDEDHEYFDFGLKIASDFFINLDATVLGQEAKLKATYAHPLIQGATLAVVSQFC